MVSLGSLAEPPVSSPPNTLWVTGQIGALLGVLPLRELSKPFSLAFKSQREAFAKNKKNTRQGTPLEFQSAPTFSLQIGMAPRQTVHVSDRTLLAAHGPPSCGEGAT